MAMTEDEFMELEAEYLEKMAYGEMVMREDKIEHDLERLAKTQDCASHAKQTAATHHNKNNR